MHVLISLEQDCNLGDCNFENELAYLGTWKRISPLHASVTFILETLTISFWVSPHLHVYPYCMQTCMQVCFLKLTENMDLWFLQAKIHKLQHEGLIGSRLCFSTLLNIKWTIKGMSVVMVDRASDIHWNSDTGKHISLTHKPHTFVLYHSFLGRHLCTSFWLKIQQQLLKSKKTINPIFSSQKETNWQQDIVMKMTQRIETIFSRHEK